MTNSHHLHWPTNTSVTIRKGNFEVTLGQKAQAVQNVPTPAAPPVKHKTPWTFQDIAFITVLLVALVLAGRWVYTKTSLFKPWRF